MLKILWMVPVLVVAAGGLCIAGQPRGAIVQPPDKTAPAAPEAVRPPAPDAPTPAATASVAPANRDRRTKPDAESGPSLGVRNFAAFLKAIQEFASGLVTIPMIVLVGLILFRQQVIDLLQALVSATGDRGVTLDFGTLVKVAVTEPPQAGVDDVKPIYLTSPFTIESEISDDSALVLEQIAPQLTFHVSDSVAEYWERHRDSKPAQQMRVHREALVKASGQPGASFESLRPALDTYVLSLAHARFREADRFAELLDRSPVLLTGLQQLAPTVLVADDDDFLAVHAAGVAFALCGNRWETSLSFLDRIAWQDQEPLYAPAGSMWIAARYHNLLATLNPDASLDSDAVAATVNALLDDGELLLEAIGTWRGAGASRGYYLRECHKDLGDVASIFAEHLPRGARRQRFLDRARIHLEQSAKTLGRTEEPSPIDHNNLADFYRQLGDDARRAANDAGTAQSCYQLAHAQIDRAFAPARPGDPAFHNTLALLLHSEQRTGEACRALAEYSIDLANRGTAQEIEEYFDNQLLAAKLLVAQYASQPALGLTAAIEVLERAVADLATMGGRLAPDIVHRLEAQTQELLGFAYLQSPRCESSAVTAFDQLVRLRVNDPNPETTFRADLGAATALSRYARLQRRQYATSAASRLCERAAPHVAAVIERIKSMTIGKEVMSAEQRDRNLRAWLDSLRAAQLLAEEWFSVREDRKADDLAKALVEPLAAINEAVKPMVQSGIVAGNAGGAPASNPGEKREAMRRVSARHALLAARLMIRADAALKAADLRARVEQALIAARGVSPQFTCEADLELGALLLNLARLGNGDPALDYLAAVAAFERATEADAPAMRGEVVRQLSYAYAMRGGILRRKPAAARKSAAE